MKRPDNGLPEDLREHARLMTDIIAMAFQTDKTRVASLILARDLSALYYPFLDVREAHHGASHNDTSEGYERIARFHLSAVRVPGAEARRDARGRRHGARQLLPALSLEHVLGSKHDNSEGAAHHRRRPRRRRSRPAAR